MKLAGLFVKAFEEAGVPLERAESQQNVPRKGRDQKARSTRKSQGKPSGSVTDDNAQRTARANKNRSPKPVHKTDKYRNQRTSSGHRSTPQPDTSDVKSTAVTPSGVVITRRTAPQPKQTFIQRKVKAAIPPQRTGDGISARISADPEARVTWTTYVAVQKNELLELPLSGREISLNKEGIEKELYLGLDFGTSTLKAVVRDKERNRSYAVPFRNISGVNGYLLPCRVFFGEHGFNLEGQGQAYQDLKLSFLASPDSVEVLQSVVAFLALTLRRIRSWVLTEHGDTYNGQIIWEVTLGLPVAHNGDKQTKQSFELLGTAAWLASQGEELQPESINQAIKRAQELIAGADIAGSHEDFGMAVEPEAAAQIYGYVSSTDFDPGARNFYLMVDAGAGTLDASLFHVHRSNSNKQEVSFSIFKTTVEPHGVMNLHSTRIKWLLATLRKELPKRIDLHNALEGIKNVTDALEPLPEKIDGYFDKLRISFQSPSPDETFYKQVKKQVASDTYARVANDGIVSNEQLTGIALYLCGGGSRSTLYARLKGDMLASPNASWFSAKYRRLQRPDGLVAPGLKAAHYDRLSVAYGLSQMKLGKVTYKVPPLEAQSRPDYTVRYTDKSMV